MHLQTHCDRQMYGAKQDPGNGSGGRTYDMCGAYYKRDEIIPQQAEHLRLSIAILPLLGGLGDILPIGTIGPIEEHMAIGPPKPDLPGKKKKLK